MIITPKIVYLEMSYDQVQCLLEIIMRANSESLTERQKYYKDEVEAALIMAFGHIAIAILGSEQSKIPESIDPKEAKKKGKK